MLLDLKVKVSQHRSGITHNKKWRDSHVLEISANLRWLEKKECGYTLQSNVLMKQCRA